MTKILIESGNILTFQGDALICFCDSDITYKRNNPILQTFAENTKSNASYKKVINQSYLQNKECEDNLLKELSAIGYCEIGNAVITKSYILNIKHFIFVPYVDHDNSENRLNYILFHQALRSAFTLANLYDIKRLAIPIPKSKFQKKDFMDKIFAEILSTNKGKGLDEKELTDIIIAITKEFVNQSLQEVFIYR